MLHYNVTLCCVYDNNAVVLLHMYLISSGLVAYRVGVASLTSQTVSAHAVQFRCGTALQCLQSRSSQLVLFTFQTFSAHVVVQCCSYLRVQT